MAQPLQKASARSRSQQIDELGDRIAELSAHLQAATFRLLTLIRDFDEREGWHAQGARTCAHWLAWRTGLDLGAAREKVRVARALAELPAIGAAMGRGEISYSKVRALTRVATPENEEELLRFARAGTASHVERLVRAWRRTDRLEEAAVDERRRRQRYVKTWTDKDGMLVVRARLEPEAGAVFLKALEAAQEELYQAERAAPDEPRAKTERGRPGADAEAAADRDGSGSVARSASADRALANGSGPQAQPDAPGPTIVPEPEPEADPDQRRADALALVAEAALGGGLEAAAANSAGDRWQVVVHVDAEALPAASKNGHAVLEGGRNVSAETSRRLACDTARVVMKHSAGGRVLDVGRKTRTIPPAIRRALAFRDRGCRFPGCGARICDAHHVKHWADGGTTRLENLVLLCKRHHRAVHEEGYRVTLDRDGSTEFFSPFGRRIDPVPPAPVVAPQPVAALASEHDDRGLEIDETTALPFWSGEPLDLSWTLHALRSIGGGAGREREPGRAP